MLCLGSNVNKRVHWSFRRVIGITINALSDKRIFSPKLHTFNNSITQNHIKHHRNYGDRVDSSVGTRFPEATAYLSQREE